MVLRWFIFIIRVHFKLRILGILLVSRWLLLVFGNLYDDVLLDDVICDAIISSVDFKDRWGAVLGLGLGLLNLGLFVRPFRYVVDSF